MLPVEAYEALFLFLAGDSISQILASRDTRVDATIDVTDFAGALNRAESQSRFVVVENDEALSAIMNAPLAQWRIFLHLSANLRRRTSVAPHAYWEALVRARQSLRFIVQNGLPRIEHPRVSVVYDLYQESGDRRSGKT